MMTRMAQVTPVQQHGRRKLEPQATSKLTPSMCHTASAETPISCPIPMDYVPSAMKGVALTSTGEILATPTPAELVNLFKCSPKVGLNFSKIFDFEEGDSREKEVEEQHEDDGASPPPSPGSRKERAKDKDKDKDDALSGNLTSSSDTSAANTRKQPIVVAVPPPTRICRPSICSSHRASRSEPAMLSTSTSDSAGFNDIDDNGASTSNGHGQAKPLPHPHLRPPESSSNLAAAAAVAMSLPIPVPRGHPLPEYDFADEENLPSPFLKRVDKAATKDVAVAVAAPSSSIPSNGVVTSGPSSSSKGPQSAHGGSGLGSSSVSLSSKVKRRGSSGLLLRAVAAANNIRQGTPSTLASTSVVPMKMNGQTS